MHQCVNKYDKESRDFIFRRGGYGSEISSCVEDVRGCLWVDNENMQHR